MQLLSYLLPACAAFALSGCGNEPSPSAASPAPVVDPDAAHKAIFQEMVAEERRATADAAAGKGQEGKLRERYWSQLAKKHGLADDQLVAISVEAYQKKWKF
jgi:hypothetical protein